MANVPKDHVLLDFQRAGPVVWVSEPRPLPQIPDVSDEILTEIFDEKRTRRLKSWAHDETGAHWLVTRGGLGLHDDIGFTRYTHQLIIRNDGWRLAGMDEQLDLPPLLTGVMDCLDTWSPHKVVRDERFPDYKKALYKCMLVVDRDEPLTEDEVWALLSPRLSDPSCATGLDQWKGRSPGYKGRKTALAEDSAK
jgi:hypothetical protein